MSIQYCQNLKTKLNIPPIHIFWLFPIFSAHKNEQFLHDSSLKHSLSSKVMGTINTCYIDILNWLIIVIMYKYVF